MESLNFEQFIEKSSKHAHIKLSLNNKTKSKCGLILNLWTERNRSMHINHPSKEVDMVKWTVHRILCLFSAAFPTGGSSLILLLIN